MHSFEQKPIAEYTEQAYYEYAQYVIQNRAIPKLEDGLKPVQRRILFAMSELGLRSTSKPKKSARTIGDVLGKFHPHGDTACYEAMVLMAQDFSYRYPLVEGQGNWGAIDAPKSFAAMRYTEAKLSPYAQLLLKDLNPHTTEWGPNFDGTLREPITLPARLPNILLNGASGIAVGLATDIPPHNIKEIGNACIALLKKPSLSSQALAEILPGPDYPTGGEIINSAAELEAIYRSGQGQIKQRASYQIDDTALTINALPHQVSSSKVIQQIADLMIGKKLPLVKNLRDESDENAQVAIVLSLKNSRVSGDDIMHTLFAETDLEKSHKVNITYISPEKKPVQTGVLPLLLSWLVFQENTLIKGLQHQLSITESRLHIIAGLVIVFEFLDEVIKIIRHEDNPKPVLMARFSLSEEQAHAILETKLKHLAKLEAHKLQEEQQNLKSLAESLKQLLEDPQARKKHIIKSIRQDLADFGDERRSKIIERKPASRTSIPQTIPKEAITILLSEKHWVRAAKGHDADIEKVSFKTGDSLAVSFKGYTHWPCILFDDSGIAYTLATHELPSARSHGEPVTKMISPSGTILPRILCGPLEQPVLLASSLGYGFISSIQALSTRNRAGKKVLSLGEASIAYAKPLREVTYLALFTQQGRLLIIPTADVPSLAKGKGNKLIQIHKKELIDNVDSLVRIQPLAADDILVVHSGKRTFTQPPKAWDAYIGTRGQRGAFLPRGYRRVTDTEIDSPNQDSI